MAPARNPAPEENNDSLVQSLIGDSESTSPRQARVSPPAIRAVAILFGAVATLSLIFAVLTAKDMVPLSAGSFLLGDFALSGPVAFACYSILNAICAAGLLALRSFARWLAVVLLIWGLLQIAPAMSNAMLDERYGSVVWWGLVIIVRVLALWYLLQGCCTEAFRRAD